MGVDLKVMLFTRPDPRDVVNVLAILDGCKIEWTDIPSIRVESAKATGIESIAGCCNLTWKSPSDGGRHWMWHWSLDHCDFAGAIPRSTAKNLALACRLVDFFGGIVQFNDCDQFPQSHIGRPDGVIWNANNGAMWKAWQDAMAALKPISDYDILKYDQYASYKTNGVRA